MPNRIIKETICTSEDLNELSPYAEILFYRLMVKADDFGAYYGNDSIVKSTCFPLRSDEIKSEQVESWLGELAKVGLIILYEAQDGRRYLQFSKWDKHQQIRAKKRKFPPFDDTCKQLISDDCKCPRNPIQSNPIHSESESKSYANGKPRKQRKKAEFVPPTVEEVREYAKSKNAIVDPDYFHEHYSLSEWHDKGGNPIQNWKQVFLNWERREQKHGQSVHGDAQKSTKQFPNVHYDNL